MFSWTILALVGLAFLVLAAFVVGFLLWVRIKSLQVFTTQVAVQADQLVRFFQAPTNLEKVHPNIAKVYNIREEDNVTYFDVEENLGAFGSKRCFPLSLYKFTDSLTSKTHLHLESNHAGAQVTISLAISDMNSLKPGSSLSPVPSLPSSTSSSLLSTSQMNVVTNTATPTSEASSEQRKLTLVQTSVKVKSSVLLCHMICKHLVQIWTRTLTNTERLLNES